METQQVQYAPPLQDVMVQNTPQQQAAASAGQQVQQIIVPESQWEKYMAFIKQQYPNLNVTATPIDAETAKKNVAEGKAMQINSTPFSGTENGAVAFNASDIGKFIKLPEGQVPEFLGAMAKQIADFAAKENGVSVNKEEIKMENNNQNVQQQQGQGMLASLQQQAENVSWGRVAKGVAIGGGGFVLGRFVFNGKSANPEAAEALMSAAETMSKADPKALANAFGTIAKAGLSKIFGV